jgi:cytochrome P450
MATLPLGTTITLADLTANPHPHLQRLRTAAPVAWLPALNGWLVTRYDLAVAVMRDATGYTVDHPGFSTAQVIGPSMLSRDGAAHRQQRDPFEAPFRRPAVQARFQRPVADLAAQLLADLRPAGHAELRRAYAGPIAVQTMVTALGLTAVPIAAVLDWYDALVDAVTRVSAGAAVSATGTAAFAALQSSLLPAVRGPATHSLLAAVSGQAQGLSDDAILANAAVLLFGGIDTTEGMIANAFYFLLTNPAWLAQVRATPALLPAVIEETLRLEPAAAVVDRYAVQDVELDGVLIKAGDLVRVSLSAANRDPTLFADPDRFDPTRPNLSRHVAFAQGPHVCLGLHLARVEAAEAIGQALAQLPDLRLVDEPAVYQAARPQGLIFRKPQALTVRW